MRVKKLIFSHLIDPKIGKQPPPPLDPQKGYNKTVNEGIDNLLKCRQTAISALKEDTQIYNIQIKTPKQKQEQRVHK